MAGQTSGTRQRNQTPAIGDTGKGMKKNILLFFVVLLLPACKPTYKKETIKESVKTLAKKEYNLDVDVQQAGRTLGVRFTVKNLLADLTSGDDAVFKNMNGLFTVLARVAVPVDV